MSTRRESVARMFTAYGASGDTERAGIYVKRMAAWSETVVEAAVTRVLDRWDRVSPPPLSELVRRCREVELEDKAHRVDQRRSARFRDAPRGMTDEEKEVCRYILELAREGLLWCDEQGAFVPMGQQVESPAPSRPQPTLRDCTDAIDAVATGELVGNGSLKARWAESLAQVVGESRERVEKPEGHAEALEAVRKRREEREQARVFD